MLLSPELRRLALPVLLVLSSMASTACAGQHGDILKYTDRPNIREGPGLLTGEQGAFTLTLGSKDSTAGAREAVNTDVSFQELRRSRDGDVPDEEALIKEYDELQRWKEWRDHQDWRKSRNDMP